MYTYTLKQARYATHACMEYGGSSSMLLLLDAAAAAIYTRTKDMHACCMLGYGVRSKRMHVGEPSLFGVILSIFFPSLSLLLLHHEREKEKYIVYTACAYIAWHISTRGDQITLEMKQTDQHDAGIKQL